MKEEKRKKDKLIDFPENGIFFLTNWFISLRNPDQAKYFSRYNIFRSNQCHWVGILGYKTRCFKILQKVSLN